MSKIYSVYLLKYLPGISRCLRGNNTSGKEKILRIRVVKRDGEQNPVYSYRIAESEDETDLGQYPLPT